LTIHFKPATPLSKHPAIAKPKATIAKHHYNAPLFVLRETFSAFKLHNGWGLSASLSFYAMFAMIPMALLMFFFLTHLVFSTHHAVINLASITSNLEPKLSKKIMQEVQKVATNGRAWGTWGTVALFWFAIPLASALRSAFQTICAAKEETSFLRRFLQDILVVIGILMMFFMFTFFDIMLEKASQLLNLSVAHSSLFDSASSLLGITALLAIFYRLSLPVHASLPLILTGSLVTATLWMGVRPLFNEVLLVNHSYGAIFGGMKNIFISLAWLYYSFAIFLLGTELISTMRKRDVLLLRGLFTDNATKNPAYLPTLMSRYGKIFRHGEIVFKVGDESRALYYIVNGKINLVYEDQVARCLSTGDFFGEMAMVADGVRFADAIVESDFCDIIVISADNIQSLILSEPKIAMNFLKHMTLQLKNSHQTQNS
jgi:membrane protein